MTIQELVRQDIEQLYAVELPKTAVQLQKTKKEFEGHLTLVVFPLLKLSKKNPQQTALEIGQRLTEHYPQTFTAYNVVNGFLNLTIAAAYWIDLLTTIDQQPDFGTQAVRPDAPLVLIEYSSPNTNKPLHLGHIRNNLLGFSLARILEATGNRVIKTNIVNDRGIHICKSMLAWTRWGNGETPQSSGKKGDHLVGEYYVRFDQEYKKEQTALRAAGLTEKEAENQSPLLAQTREMLRRWEAGDSEILQLWKTMNGWVYEGFDQTYAALGVDFDQIYYESQTYLQGKEKVLEGLRKGIFYQKEDHSVWADLRADGLDEKLLLRADGTSVYMTQDIGTAKLRFDDYPIDRMIYVVGNEQNYHFQVLALLLDKLGFGFGKTLVHFSYGMVELPDGKMKSREGTVVDADDLIAEMIRTARQTSEQLGKLSAEHSREADQLAQTIGLAALKYFILKVDPRKNMTFNPQESIDFNGNTGPFIQYTYARIQSLKRKNAGADATCPPANDPVAINEKEMGLIRTLAQFPDVVREAADTLSPALIANYTYELAKEYNQYYHDYTILGEADPALRRFRLRLSHNTGQVIRTGLRLLGINAPEQM